MQEPRGVSLELGYSTGLSVPACREQEKSPARSTTAPEECESCPSSTTGRGTDRERCKEGASVGGTGQMSARSAQPGNLREPGLYWRSLEAPGKVNASHSVFYLIFENDDC